MRTEAAQCSLKKCAHRHRKAARVATEDSYVAQAARADDQAMLIGLWDQLDDAHVKAFTTMRQ